MSQLKVPGYVRACHAISAAFLSVDPTEQNGLDKAVALAETAIQSGQAACFRTAHDLATDLGRAYREGRLDRRLRIYLAPRVLVIDEMGYLPLEGCDDLLSTGRRPLRTGNRERRKARFLCQNLSNRRHLQLSARTFGASGRIL